MTDVTVSINWLLGEQPLLLRRASQLNGIAEFMPMSKTSSLLFTYASKKLVVSASSDSIAVVSVRL